MTEGTKRLANKVAIVTGGSRGIGEAISKRLSADGARVVVGYSAGEAAALKVISEIQKCGGEATAIQVDLSSPEAIPIFFSAAEGAFGKPDILVNNAGVPGKRQSIDRVDAADYTEVFDVNVRGALLSSAEMSRRMNDGGRIIYISSGASRMAGAGRSVYAASKAAVEAFARSQAIDLGSRGITVNAVAPGVTDTGKLPPQMADWARKFTALGRVGNTEEFASVVAFLCSNDGGWITGQVIDANGGIHVL